MTGVATSAERSENRALQKGESSSWPQYASHEPTMAIGAVVKSLSREFPATTVSKIRFLEEKGLVKPHRTASGYRKYSHADVERIRYVLTQQRDSYAPLRVIHENLVALDAGHQADDPRPARLITNEGKSVAPSGRSTVSVRELSDLTGVNRETLEEYTKLGLIAPDLGGHFPSQAVVTVNLIGKLVAFGVPARNLRSVRTGAERSADIIEQVTVGVTRRDRSADRERAKAEALDLSELFSQLHSQYLHATLAALDV